MRIETKYRILVISMFVVLLMFGVYIGFNVGKGNSANELAESVMNKNTEDEVSIYTESKAEEKYDIELVYEEEYTLCGHKIDNSEIISNTTLEELKEKEIAKQKESENEYEVLEESNERLVFYKKVDQNCPNHFNVKLENGIVVVYSRVNDTVSTVYQKIDIPQDLISPEMIEELNVGIKVDSKEDLNLIIEDLES